MYYFGFLCIVLAMVAAFAAALCALVALWSPPLGADSLANDKEREVERKPYPIFIEHAHIVTTLGLVLAGAALLHGLFWQDYSLQYAANYTDKYLALFYRITAFWVGQPGSMLFWALVVSVCASLFAYSKAHASLKPRTKLWFWLFQHTLLIFFTLLLARYSNPFLMQTPVPADGNGLNPLLQNPGMIIHPPLLFIGYAGFVVPTCLALAAHLAHEPEKPWFVLTRPYLLLSWMFLTAGIMLGAWWAYMELGWGGYWAWDPVENSSLVPWLLATALLHTVSIEKRTGKFSRFNLFLVSLTTIATLFATYLVRSGIIDSVHAFGSGSVGTPLLVGIALFLLLSLFVAGTEKSTSEPIPEILSKDAFLSFMSWFLLALAFIITLATLWPVVSSLFSTTRSGLDATFYNRTCLPLASVLLLFLAFCPWIQRIRRKNFALLAFLLVIFAGSMAFFWFMGYGKPVPLLALSSTVTIGAGLILYSVLAARKKEKWAPAAFGAHLGLAFCALGIAFSGPYSFEKDILFAEGEGALVNEYRITLERVHQEDGEGYSALIADIDVERDGKGLGVLSPERRIYEKFGDMQFSEVDTLFSLGNELYVSLLGMTAEKKILVRFSIKPLVNWLWFGGICMSLLPLLAFVAGREKRVAREDSEKC
ncbi:MAG: heme lyase CcmF/NrfE family subunit [Desulfovibrionaceae bacterium]|nr:heme lyase CcmF/NrfE family subunit [Desulfovibrionaceae bacterium]